LLQLFHDLSAQDLPPLFEDNLQSIFALLLKYLNPRASPDGIFLKNPALAQIMDGVDDETSPQDGQKIRAEICSIGELYAQRYLDAAAGSIPGFVENVWEMLGRCGQGEKEDIVSVSRRDYLRRKLIESPSSSSYQRPSPFCLLLSRCHRKGKCLPMRLLWRSL
jgi:exportin-2 (importin alpha re-exporter)